MYRSVGLIPCFRIKTKQRFLRLPTRRNHELLLQSARIVTLESLATISSVFACCVGCATLFLSHFFKFLSPDRSGRFIPWGTAIKG
jgi:hypothetical protein